ncbi:MAG TPA: adenylate/guanylate cyclase domain-containing protein [Vicinamibacterales bacterium]|nr:adenylate/guanylate cyclase domain-containing protein [Vicinamibacterales bacterium]
MHKLIPVAAALLAGALGLLPFFNAVELYTYDARVAATARQSAPSDQIVLVSIDNESLRRLEPLVGRWPWPRLVHATLIDFLSAAGAKVIVYDVLFAERDIRKFMVGDSEWTGDESDRALVDSTRKAGNVIHIAEAASPELVDPSRALVENMNAPALNVRLPTSPCVERRPRATPPFPALAQASRGIGHSLLTIDADGAVRRMAPVVQIGERTIPSVSMATVMATGVTPSMNVEPAADGQCSALIAWRGPAENANGAPTFTSYSFYDLFYSQQQLIEGQKPGVDPALFKNRIVVVGANAEGLYEVFTTPFRSGEINGPEVHANVIDALLANRSIDRSPAWVTLTLIIAGAAGVGIAGLFLNAWLTGAVALALVLLLAGAAVWYFARGVWIPVTAPALAIIFGFVGDLAWKYFVEGRDKRLIKKMFSRYVSKDVFDQLVANPSLAALGGARRHMTVLFSDIRGFTTMSEKGTPEDVVAQLNQLFTRMVGVVFDHRGTVDKFVGDMVMALYGAPLDDESHADHAVETALEMIRTLQEMNAEWRTQGKPTLDIGIGINTGDMVAGNIGSDTIMSYTVIGDAVNLGARLESLNKDYGTRIIISEFTRAELKGRYDIHPLGEVVVKGKTRPVAIFEVKPT